MSKNRGQSLMRKAKRMNRFKMTSNIGNKINTIKNRKK